MRWDIAEGYYLYRDRILITEGPNAPVRASRWPSRRASLPMVPIISSIVVGGRASPRRAVALTLACHPAEGPTARCEHLTILVSWYVQMLMRT
ncbi:hypothetical protein JC881_12355 [Variovorax sp. IB41]|nr:hypothetical protein [Variovorax sp. IB41]